MKKIKILFVTLLCIITVFAFSGCNTKKEALSADDFCNKLEKKEFTITDSTSQYASQKEITESYIAISKNYSYQIEFIVLNSDDSAVSMFNTNKNIFENEKSGIGDITTSVNIGNQSKYSILTNGKYKVVSRIGNTLIYVNADSQYKDEIKSILEDIGY